jgi:SPP1 gp7 family putative phage head morphogenesis protein
MWTDEQFDELEQEERTITDEAIAAMLLILANIKGELEKELRDFYSKYGKDGVVTYQEARKWVSNENHTRRITWLLLLLSDQFDKLHDKLDTKFDNFLVDVIQKEQDFFDVDLDRTDVINADWGTDDSTWYNRLADDVGLWKTNVANDLKRSFMRQDNVEDVIEQLDKRFTNMENVVQKLAMTESTAVGSLARREIFKELGIKKYRYYAREDERTCDVCGSLHGLVFPVSSYEIGVNASPMHPWCRCWEVPIVE